MIRISLYLFILLLAIACKKANERVCFKSTGIDSVKLIEAEFPIDSLFLNDNLNYLLIPDSNEFIQLEGGAHLIDFIEVLQSAGKIEISNTNKCDFLRSFKEKMTVSIHLKRLNYLEYTGGGNVTTLDTIDAPDFRLRIVDGGGPVHLILESGYLEGVITKGYGDFTIQGKTIDAFLLCQANSYCNTKELQVQGNLHVTSNSSADMHVNANGSNFTAQIYKRGNIYYAGNPNQLITEIFGEGSVLSE